MALEIAAYADEKQQAGLNSGTISACPYKCIYHAFFSDIKVSISMDGEK